jgi:hypothetical protein
MTFGHYIDENGITNMNPDHAVFVLALPAL